MEATCLVVLSHQARCIMTRKVNKPEGLAALQNKGTYEVEDNACKLIPNRTRTRLAEHLTTTASLIYDLPECQRIYTYSPTAYKHSSVNNATKRREEIHSFNST